MWVISTSFPLRLVLSVHPSTPPLPLLCQKPVLLCSYAVSSQTEVTGRTHLAASRAAGAPAPPRKPTAASGEGRGATGVSCRAKTPAEPSTLTHSRADVAPAEAPAHPASACHSCWNRGFRGCAPAHFLSIFTSRCAAWPSLPLHCSQGITSACARRGCG